MEHGEFTQVLVCNAGHVKNVPGRKTDLLTELPGGFPGWRVRLPVVVASTTALDRGEMPGRREHRAGIVAGQRSASIHLAL